MPAAACPRPALSHLLTWSGLLLLWASAAGAFDSEDGYAPELDGVVHALAVQPSGHAIVGGDFTTANGASCPRLCRLDAAGRIATGFLPTDLNGTVHVLLVESDGSVTVGGAFTEGFGRLFARLLRLDADGAIAASAGAGVNATVRALARQPDGRLLIGGDFTQIGGFWPSRRLARQLSSGSTDTSFLAEVDGSVLAIAVLDDGRILIGGTFASVNGVARQNLALLLPSGQVDFGAAFDANGAVRSLSRDIDGTVVIGGDFTRIDGIELTRLARMTPDASFVYGLADAEASVRATHVHSDGQLILGGDFLAVDGAPRARLARLDQERQLDPRWSASSNGAVHAIAEQPDGSLLVGGSFTQANGEARSRLARVTPQGQLERTLNVDIDPASAVLAVVEQADGGLLLGGSFASVDGQAREGIARLASDGALDAGFAPTVSGGDVRALLALPDGAALLAGNFTAVNGNARRGLARLLANGSLDNAFRFDGNFSGQLFGMKRAQNDRVYLAGSFGNIGSHDSSGVARLHIDTGEVDTDFSADVQPRAFNVIVQTDGRLLVIGGTEVDGVAHPAALSRLLPDGARDPAFNPQLAQNARVSAAALLPDGRMLVAFGLTLNGEHFIRRLRADGGLDDGFSAVANGPVTSIALRADGIIAIGGPFTSVFGVPRHRYALLGPTGVLFGGALPEASDSVIGALFQHDGKLLLHGSFDTLGGLRRTKLARLSTPDAAQYGLAFDGRSLRWLRAGAAPELELAPRVAIGGVGQTLPESIGLQRMPGGWQIADPELLAHEAVFVRLQLHAPTPSDSGTSLAQREYLRLNPQIFRSGFEPGSAN